jgi:nucleoside-diphosphate-sugar epimerase
MNILVTGASGFIASQIVTDLLAAGHSVTCCVRNISYTENLFPTAKVISCNFVKDTTADHWVERLKNIDVVINCVGILYHPNKKIIWNIHYETPRALFDACVKVGVKKIIQISALGVDKTDVDYAKSKKAADDYLLSLPIKSVVLRPSLVYGRGSYGGTSLFRGLAGLPWIIPVPGKGNQEFQPIHLQDLSKSVLNFVEKPIDKSVVLSAVSSEKVTLKVVLTKLRSWLGFPKALLLSIPLIFIRIASFFGDFIPYSAMNSSSYKMLNQNNITTENEVINFREQLNFTPREFSVGVYSEPSTVQDHWHARLFFLKPLLQLSISFVWIFTAVCSLFLFPRADAYALLAQAGVNEFWQPILLVGSSVLDAALGIAMLFNFQLKKTCTLQIILMLGYTFILTWKMPQIWSDPFAPLAKNIPLIVATLIFMAMESDR